MRAEAYRLIAQAGAGPDHELLRIMITRGGRRVMMTERLPDTPMKLRLKTVTYGPTRILDGIKSLSYASNMLAGRMAREQGFDDALLVTPHGRVLEAPTSSIFWVKDGELLTPPLDDHILASITRALVLEVTDAQERSCPLEQLVAADEVFIASTTREVQPVIAVDGQSSPATGPSPRGAAELVSERIRAAARAGEGRHRHRQPPAVHQGGGGLSPAARSTRSCWSTPASTSTTAVGDLLRRARPARPR